jgi:hypothetical protein
MKGPKPGMDDTCRRSAPLRFVHSSAFEISENAIELQ